VIYNQYYNSVRRECALASESAIFNHVMPSKPAYHTSALSALSSPLAPTSHTHSSCLFHLPPVFHPYCQQIEAIPQTVKLPCSSHTKTLWPTTRGSPTSHQLMSKPKKAVVPHSMCLMLPLADHPLAWTFRSFGRIQDVYRKAQVLFCMFSACFRFRLARSPSTS